MVSLIFQWAMFLEGAVHHSSSQHTPGRGTAVALGEGSCTDTNEQSLRQGTGITWTALDKATSNLTLVSNDLKRTRSHLAQTPLENKSTPLSKETYFKHKWRNSGFFTCHERQYQHKLFSKSSALALLWMVNKSKKRICLTQHIRWPRKTCLHCYNFANELSTLLIKNCIFCCKYLSPCMHIYLYIPP